ncbi:hypothetical protein BH23BAC2_BH23BAC2_07890 [soil metagenome]
MTFYEDLFIIALYCFWIFVVLLTDTESDNNLIVNYLYIMSNKCPNNQMKTSERNGKSGSGEEEYKPLLKLKFPRWVTSSRANSMPSTITVMLLMASRKDSQGPPSGSRAWSPMRHPFRQRPELDDLCVRAWCALLLLYVGI